MATARLRAWGEWDRDYRAGNLRRARFTLDADDFESWRMVVSRYPDLTTNWIAKLEQIARDWGQSMGRYKMRVRCFGAILVLIGGSLFAKNLAAAELRVLAVGATAPTLKRVIPEFEKATDNKVIVWFGPPAPIVDMIAKGDTVDAVFISGPRYDDLVKNKTIEAGTIIAKLGVGVGVPKGSPRPDITTADSLNRTLVTAKSIGGLVIWNQSSPHYRGAL
jgi:Bacterial extracellular solute-binding protein